ncbi:DUF3164 family protein [Moraxella lacunata]|uniref:Sulfate transporter n=1 Tax=Moraxella lacunata TaxID=477 RepID=A0A1B8Q801_MORLA|nr:DUF3164 family protein [Moraxella lacunata]MDI4482779.1 DUF3164 family protein [Moraxella lacunata]MDI4507264.1 DUF3164 family protein [Moraxella lacunata]OBX61404.1 sulfate transporter [Moraxella lacunata]OBX67246.1 sulfate transporter [Moraxella lacunata]
MTNPTPNTQTAPEGYVMNAKGHYVPLSAVKEIDKLRDDVVQDIISRAKELRSQMIGVKDIMFGNFHEFVELSAHEYDTKIGGQKGNVSLLSFDGKYKVQIAIQDNLVFDERLQVAKSLIDECLRDWTKDSNDNIKAIIDNAFAVDKEGKINIRRVLSLRSLNITDDKWQKAMQAISDATQVISSKEYMRFYERDEYGKYQQISLDFANL